MFFGYSSNPEQLFEGRFALDRFSNRKNFLKSIRPIASHRTAGNVSPRLKNVANGKTAKRTFAQRVKNELMIRHVNVLAFLDVLKFSRIW